MRRTSILRGTSLGARRQSRAPPGRSVVGDEIELAPHLDQVAPERPRRDAELAPQLVDGQALGVPLEERAERVEPAVLGEGPSRSASCPARRSRRRPALAALRWPLWRAGHSCLLPDRGPRRLHSPTVRRRGPRPLCRLRHRNVA